MALHTRSLSPIFDPFVLRTSITDTMAETIFIRSQPWNLTRDEKRIIQDGMRLFALLQGGASFLISSKEGSAGKEKSASPDTNL